MRLGHVQANFTAGEVSPRLLGRTDLTKFQNGLFELENGIVQRHGGASRRPGTVWVAHTRADRAARLIPFQFSVTQTYVVEFTANGTTGWCRFYRDAGQVKWSNSATAGPTVSAYSWLANVTTLTISPGHLFEVNDRITVSAGNPVGLDITDAIVLSVLTGPDRITYAQAPDPTDAFVSATIDGPYTITNPFIVATDPDELKFTQSADILYITHNDYQPQEMQRTGVDQFVFADYTFKDGPYLNIDDDVTLTTVAGTGAATGPFVASTASFAAADVTDGRVIRWKDLTLEEWGWGYIDTFNSTTSVDVNVQVNVTNVGAGATWRLGAWGGDQGWPETTTFHQQRLWFANSTAKPQTMWSTVTAGFNTFSPTELATAAVADDSGMAFTLDDDQVNAIWFLKSTAKGMVVMTEGGEFLMQSASSSDSITPTNVGVARQTNFGSRRRVSPLLISNTVVFVQKAGRKIREFAYFFEDDQFRAVDLTLLSEHVTVGKVKWLEYQQEPSSIIWAIDEAGLLLSLTYDRLQEVVAWGRQPLGGASTKALSLASIFENDVDRLWMCVERLVNSSTVRFVEYVSDQFDTKTAIADAFFVDAGITYSGATATVMGGLGHLEGEVIDVLTDGAAHPQLTVSSGMVTLQVSATKVQMGLPYTTQGKSLPLFAMRAPFETRGRTISCYKVLMNFYRTVGAKAGPDISNMDNVAFREGSDPMDTAVDPFTGTFEADIDGRHDHQPLIVFQQTQPLPFTLLSMIYRLEVNEP